MKIDLTKYTTTKTINTLMSINALLVVWAILSGGMVSFVGLTGLILSGGFFGYFANDNLKEILFKPTVGLIVYHVLSIFSLILFKQLYFYSSVFFYFWMIPAFLTVAIGASALNSLESNTD